MGSDRSIAHGLIQKGSTSGANKAILVNVSQLEDKAGGSDDQVFYGLAGFYCWPDPPADDGAGCEVFTVREADGDPVIASRDLRLSKRVTPAEGDVGAVHYGGGYLTLRWDEDHRGSVVVLSSTRLNAQLSAVEAAHGLLMDPSEGNSSIQLLHALGSGLVMNKDGDSYLSNADSTGRVVVYDNGAVYIRCDQGLKVSGATIVGDITTAREVALVAQVIALAQAVLAMASTISTQLMAVPTPGIGLGADIAAITAAITQLQGIGTAKTLKASPV